MDRNSDQPDLSGVLPLRSFLGGMTRFVVCALLVTTLSGCSLFIMAGKMFLGDPLQTSAFKSQTRIDLVKDEKQVVVLCRVLASADESGGLYGEIMDGVIRRFKRQGIRVVDSDSVEDFLQQNGSWDRPPSDVANAIPADVIVEIEVDRFSVYEENSPNLYRCRLGGTAYGYEIVDTPYGKQADQVFAATVNFQYPELNAISADRRSEMSFRSMAVSDFCEKLGRLFYDYRNGDGF